MPAPKKYPDELRERAVRMVFQIREETGQQQGAIASVASKLGINRETLEPICRVLRDAGVQSPARCEAVGSDAPRLRTPRTPRPGRICCNGTSPPRHPTGAGSPTSPTCRSPPARSTPRSSWTASRGSSSGGGWPDTCAPAYRRTRWRWPCGNTKAVLKPHPSLGSGQYLSIRYTERLSEAGASVSVGSKGDFYDNALAETVIGLYKTELAERHGPWRGLDDLELATLGYIDWFNHRRLHSACDYRPSAEHEAAYYDQTQPLADLAGVQ